MQDISEAFLLPVLEMVIEQFQCVIEGFHSDIVTAALLMAGVDRGTIPYLSDKVDSDVLARIVARHVSAGVGQQVIVDIPDGVSLPKEIKLRKDRLAAMATAKAKITARTAERYPVDVSTSCIKRPTQTDESPQN